METFIPSVQSGTDAGLRVDPALGDHCPDGML
jgi:hypothetical protein